MFMLTTTSAKTGWLTAAGATLFTTLFGASAVAQNIEGESRFGVQLHVGEVSATTRDSWNDNDNMFQQFGEEIGFGISASYYFDPSVSLRATYERASGFQSYFTEIDRVEQLISIDSASSRTEHFSLVIMPQFDITSSLYGFANLGIAYTEYSVSEYNYDTSDTSVVYGLGFGYRVSERVRLSGEFSRTGDEYEALRFSIGYRF